MRVAAVQSMPVVLDLEATINKVVDLLGQAADRGAQLVVLPEPITGGGPRRGLPGPDARGVERHEALGQHHQLGAVVGGLAEQVDHLVDRRLEVEHDRHRLHRCDPLPAHQATKIIGEVLAELD